MAPHLLNRQLSTEVRTSLTRFRLGNSGLGVEKARYEGVTFIDRTCTRCTEGVVDDATSDIFPRAKKKCSRREVRRFVRQNVRLERGLLPQLMPSSTGKVNGIGAGFDKDSVVDHQLKEGLAGKPVMPLLLVDHMAFTNFKLYYRLTDLYRQVTGEKEPYKELMASNHNALMLQFREVLLKECKAFGWENIDNVRVCGMQGEYLLAPISIVPRHGLMHTDAFRTFSCRSSHGAQELSEGVERGGWTSRRRTPLSVRNRGGIDGGENVRRMHFIFECIATSSIRQQAEFAMTFQGSNENLHDFMLSPCAPLFVHLALKCVTESPEPLEGEGGQAA
ncbi:hypothetical protein QJQ45_016432 [Haematococcus lacustris]|nr:hypothetical protein QJQ45_016432 [Haematococcus lacustris]